MPKRLAVQLAERATGHGHGLVVKFQDESGVHLVRGRFVVDADDADGRIRTELEAVLADLAAHDVQLQPMFWLPPAALLEMKLRYSRRDRPLADLRTYAQAVLGELPHESRATLVRRLNDHALVEIAYLDPMDEPALRFAPLWPTATDIKPQGASPLLIGEQFYLRAAPLGVAALKAWIGYQATGAGVRVLLYDNGMRATHEDLPALFRTDSNNPVDQMWIDHGTANLSVIAAVEDGIGISGIAHGANIGFIRARHSQVDGFGVTHAERLLLGAQALSAGDVFLLEVGRTPNLGLDCPDNPSQAGQVPLEYYPAEFHVIQTLTAQGITVVQGAGNGCVDFDSPELEALWGDGSDHSGAILVGAADSGFELQPPFAAVGYTGFGARIDLHAWGDNVVAASFTGASCNDDDLACPEWLYFEGDPDRKYVARYRGTSSAAAVVAGAAAVLQGKFKALYNQPLSPELLRDVLRATGTPQGGDAQARPIGRMPNLEAALQFILPP